MAIYSCFRIIEQFDAYSYNYLNIRWTSNARIMKCYEIEFNTTWAPVDSWEIQNKIKHFETQLHPLEIANNMDIEVLECLVEKNDDAP